MDLRELGALLKAERERQGISVNEITDQIKIGRTALIAIEEGEESKLPHPVYAKGFIKNYARLLHLDADEINQTLSAVFNEEEDVSMRPAYQESRETVTSIKAGGGGAKKSSPLGVILLLLILLAGGALWYFYFLVPDGALITKAPSQEQSVAEPAPLDAPQSLDQPAAPKTAPDTLDAPPADSSAASPADSLIVPPADSLDGQQALPGEPSVSEQALSAETPLAPAAEQPAADQPVVDQPAADQPAPTQDADAGQGQDAVQSQEEGLPVSDSGVADEGVILGEGPNVVEIVAKDICWLEAAVDGGAMNETTLQKGQRLTGRFEDVLLVRLGNAGGVDIRFNGKPYAFDGAGGQVKTLKFTTKHSAQAEPAPQDAAPASATPAAETATATAGEKILEAYGADGSWMIVIPDGKNSKEIFVKKGERVTFPFEKFIEVRLGNPSDLVFTYDGKEYPASSAKGESKSLRFP